jgi:hypothetical protein
VASRCERKGLSLAFIVSLPALSVSPMGAI